jgi:hypothetical protein
LWLVAHTPEMKIEIKKKTAYQCEYGITRNDNSTEQIILETKTYLVHDICHYVVEKNLNYSKGFWGMLSLGYSFNALFGKNNAQTAELRFIEQIVGPVQSVHWGHITKQGFAAHISHVDFTMSENFLTSCLTEIDSIIENWSQLTTGQQMTLIWKL